MNMKQSFVGAFLLVVTPVSCAVPSLAQDPFKPAEVTSTPFIQSPTLSGEPRVLVLDVSLDEMGAIAGSTVVRDVPFLTSVATSSVRSWKFVPASTRSVPEASVFRVAFVFLPYGFLAVGPSSPPKHSDGTPDRMENQGYVPPSIMSIAYPRYPFNAAVPGAVVIQVTINESGTTRYLDVVRDLRPFTQFALSAASKWQFQAATLNGRSTTSNLAIAFVFAPLPATQF
jgi:hypothetical protein